MLAYSPLLFGAYSRDDRQIPGQYAGPDADARLDALRKVVDRTGATLVQVIYAWLIGGNPAIIPITAPTTVEQLAENLGGLDLSLTAEHMEGLSRAGA